MPRSVWPGGVSLPGSVPSWLLVKINPVLAEPRIVLLHCLCFSFFFLYCLNPFLKIPFLCLLLYHFLSLFFIKHKTTHYSTQHTNMTLSSLQYHKTNKSHYILQVTLTTHFRAVRGVKGVALRGQESDVGARGSSSGLGLQLMLR